MELCLSTLAHHLGFRVPNWDAQDEFVQLDDKTHPLSPATKRARTLHPVNRLWTRVATLS